MASPTAEPMQNGISTPPTTAFNAPNNNSPPTQQSLTQPNTSSQSQPSQQAQTNGGPTAIAMNPSFPPTSLQDPGLAKRPRDARLIHLTLARMGVHIYTERVPLQLLDFAYRYTSSILSDAQSYEPPAPTGPTTHTKKRGGAHAANHDIGDGGDGVGLNAVRTAVAARAAGQFNTQLGKEFLMDVASEKNKIALPRVEREFGVRLPPERYCFTGAGWGVGQSWEGEEGVDEEEGDMELDGDAEMGLVDGEVGFGGPVGGTEDGDTGMGGMGEMGMDGEGDEEEFEDVMG